MDLSDYLLTLRRQWPLLLGVLATAVLLASAYLLVTPKTYSATATVLLSVNGSSTISDAASGVQFVNAAAGTVAEVIGSNAVLDGASRNGPEGLDVGTYEGAITASARNGGGVIDISAKAGDGVQAAEMANAVASQAQQLVPGLVGASPASSPVRLRVIESARPPDTPLSPDARGVLVIALAAGLILGLGLSIARQALDTRVRRPEDLVSMTDARLLAVVPRLNRTQRRFAARDGIVVKEDPAGPVGDAFRSLRTNISNLEVVRSRTFLIAPAQEDHLGPFVALNLAWSIAQSGREVLIVDLDLRHPRVNEALNRPLSPGLGEVLAGDASLNTVVQATDNPQMHLLAAGQPQTSPSDLLSTPRMGSVYAALEDSFDYIVLNAPAVSDYTDAAVAAKYAGWTLITVASSLTRRDGLHAALTTLRSAGVDSMGLVLTGVNNARGTNRRLRSGGGLTDPSLNRRKNGSREAPEGPQPPPPHDS